MQAINDNELILFHYRDGLDAARLAEIEAALAESADLRARHQSLCRLLGDVDMQQVEPSANFEQRLWARFEQRIADESMTKPEMGWFSALRGRFSIAGAPRLAWASAAAALLVVALGIGFLAGRSSIPEPVVSIPAHPSSMASRVLDSYVAGHLRATEGLLMTAVNDDSGNLLKGNQELAGNLVESNRLYAVAAARAGNTRLADFLRQLEPVLIEMANRPDGGSIESRQGLRDFLRDTDLLFQVRATESRIDADSKRSL